jgi:hypothetical protein
MCSNDFKTQKVYFSQLMRVYVGFIMLAAYLCILANTNGVQLCIDKSRLACTKGLVLYWSFSSSVGVQFAQSYSQWVARVDT